MNLSALYEHKQLFTVQHLYKTSCKDVPLRKGVYFVVVPDLFEVNFSNTTTAIREHNGQSLLYPAADLECRYQKSDKRILYIGKASGERNMLRQRLRQLVRYSRGEVHNHRGGRTLWQICNAQQLLIGYLPCEQAAKVEADLLREYSEMYGVLPTANCIFPTTRLTRGSSLGFKPDSRQVST